MSQEAAQWDGIQFMDALSKKLEFCDVAVSYERSYETGKKRQKVTIGVENLRSRTYKALNFVVDLKVRKLKVVKYDHSTPHDKKEEGLFVVLDEVNDDSVMAAVTPHLTHVTESEGVKWDWLGFVADLHARFADKQAKISFHKKLLGNIISFEVEFKKEENRMGVNVDIDLHTKTMLLSKFNEARSFHEECTILLPAITNDLVMRQIEFHLSDWL